MAAKSVSTEISAAGTWEIMDAEKLRSDIPARVTFRKGSGADPIGTVLSLGIKTGSLTPEPIAGARATLPTLASTTSSLPVRIYPDGRLCVTVTTYVAPFIVEVIQ